MLRSTRRAIAARLTPEQKQAAVNALHETLYQITRPTRLLRRLTIGLRVPNVQGRSWRSRVPPRLASFLNRGLMKYSYRGVPMLKHPVDVALYLKLLNDLRPATVIEIGSRYGGTALWLEDMLTVLGNSAAIYSIDIVPPTLPLAKRVKFIKGDESMLADAAVAWNTLPHPWLVINDASHQPTPLLASLQFFDRQCLSGDYLVVEDSFITAFGGDAHLQGGPAKAIADFLSGNPRWKIDATYCDFFGYNVTANSNGYLMRV